MIRHYKCVQNLVRHSFGTKKVDWTSYQDFHYFTEKFENNASSDAKRNLNHYLKSHLGLDTFEEYKNTFLHPSTKGIWSTDVLYKVSKVIFQHVSINDNFEEFKHVNLFDLSHVEKILRNTFKMMTDQELKALMTKAPQIYIACHLREYLELRKPIMESHNFSEYPDTLDTCSNFEFAKHFLSYSLTRKDFEVLTKRNPIAFSLNPVLLAEIHDYAINEMSLSTFGEVKTMDQHKKRKDRFKVKIPIGEAKIWQSDMHKIMSCFWILRATKNWPPTSFFKTCGKIVSPVTILNTILLGSSREVGECLNLVNMSGKQAQFTSYDLDTLEYIFQELYKSTKEFD